MDEGYSSFSDSVTEEVDGSWGKRQGRVGLFSDSVTEEVDGSCGKRQGRVGLFLCQCGCGQEFFATIVTRHPRYANKTHRARAYRARAQALAMAYHMANKTPGQMGVLYEQYYDKFLSMLLQRNRGR